MMITLKVIMMVIHDDFGNREFMISSFQLLFVSNQGNISSFFIMFLCATPSKGY